MFLTALVWGFGVTLGGSVGLMAFVLMNYGFKRVAESETAKSIEYYHKLSQEALVERNMLTKRQIAVLERLAEANESMAGQ